MNPDYVRDDYCPACGYHIDSASEPLQPLERPGWGDISMCLSCGSILRYNPAMKLQLADESELDAAQAAYIAKLRAAKKKMEKEVGRPPGTRPRKGRGLASG